MNIFTYVLNIFDISFLLNQLFLPDSDNHTRFSENVLQDKHFFLNIQHSDNVLAQISTKTFIVLSFSPVFATKY